MMLPHLSNSEYTCRAYGAPTLTLAFYSDHTRSIKCSATIHSFSFFCKFNAYLACNSLGVVSEALEMYLICIVTFLFEVECI